jgi:hypothetical protein
MAKFNNGDYVYNPKRKCNAKIVHCYYTKQRWGSNPDNDVNVVMVHIFELNETACWPVYNLLPLNETDSLILKLKYG